MAPVPPVGVLRVSDSYRLIRMRSGAGDFHARPVPDPTPCELWWLEVDAAAVVIGSSQPDHVVDRAVCARAGVDIVRRRSGGGAVLLVPGEVTWLDVIVPRGTAAWSDDIHGPMRWLGGELADVVRELVPGADVGVHGGPMLETAWSSTVCFDGVGVGEVMLDGAKLVGISQRRTRHAARLQCCWYSHYDAERLVELLAPAQRPPLGSLAPVATVPPPIARHIAEALADRLA